MIVKSRLALRFASLNAFMDSVTIADLVWGAGGCLLMTILLPLLAVAKIVKATFSFFVRHAMELKPK